jgi:hypothetical protein
MKRETKHILAGISVTIAIVLSYFYFSNSNQVLLPIILIFFCGSSFFTDTNFESNNPIFGRLKWNTNDWLSNMVIFLTAILFLMILCQLPEEKSRKIIGQWYVLLDLWILMILSIIQKYIKEENPNEGVSANLDTATAESK